MYTSPVQRILVPVDLSDFSDLAMQFALLSQKKLGSQITVMYAEEFTYVFTGEYPIGYYFEDVGEMKKHTSKLLHKWITEHVPSTCPVATMIVDDFPARAIVRTADDVNADLIIMGTHGRHGIRRAILGSVTERVLRETERPVLTVVPDQFGSGEVAIGKILCPVNYTPVSDAAAQYARVLGGWFGVEVKPVNVPEGDAAQQILQSANDEGFDLIVVGAQHKFFSDATVIGTTTERITRFARQPVLTIVRRAVAQKEVKHEALAVVA